MSCLLGKCLGWTIQAREGFWEAGQVEKEKEAKAPEEEVPEDAQGTGPSSQDLPLQT